MVSMPGCGTFPQQRSDLLEAMLDGSEEELGLLCRSLDALNRAAAQVYVPEIFLK